MRVLGIDPGITNTGYGAVEEREGHLVVCGHGSITTPRDEEMSRRLDILYADIRQVIGDISPDVAVLEELFFSRNRKTAMAVGQARGVIILACRHEGVDCHEYTPLQVKQALVGRGNADKRQVRYMVSVLLKMEEAPSNSHASDALAVGICHLHHRQMGGLLASEEA